MTPYDEAEPQPCERCGSKVNPSRHHVWPKRYNWPTHLQDLTVCLCRECHDEIEEEIAVLERDGGKRSKYEYAFITLDFITS